VSGYIPASAAARQDMLRELGLESEGDLFAGIPEGLKLNRPLNLPPGKSELETITEMKRLAGRNTVFKSVFRGAGAYRHFIPALVKRVTAKEEFVTAYTPYQPEISQGVLQSIFEFQTMICELTGMDAANASVYDGAAAAAEAAAMCRDRNRQTVVISAASHPHTIETVKTYCATAGARLLIAPHKNGVTDPEALEGIIDNETACVYIQQPNFFGQIERAREIGQAAHERGAMFIMGCNPIAMAILKTPADCGADIAVGEGQPLGMPLAFGGPYLGFMTCKKDLVRRLPGRIVGETHDKGGRRAFVLTLQAREQHIRREKAASNICTNQALCSMTAAVYMAVMGPAGMRDAAEQCMAKAHYLQRRLAGINGFEPVFTGAFFHEFVTRCPIPTDELNKCLEEHGILGGLPLNGDLTARLQDNQPPNGDLEGSVLWCATELNTKAQIDALIDIIRRRAL